MLQVAQVHDCWIYRMIKLGLDIDEGETGWTDESPSVEATVAEAAKLRKLRFQKSSIYSSILAYMKMLLHK